MICNTVWETTIIKALDSPAPHLGTVRQLLDLERHRRDQPPPLPIALPDDPRVRDLRVRSHSLDDYQLLIGPHDDEPDTD